MGNEVASRRVLTIPNAISFARLILVFVFGWLVLTEHDLIAVIVLAVAAGSDWVDGYLARHLHQTSRLGEVLDPAIDRVLIVVTLLTLAIRDIIPWWLVIVLFAREIMLAVLLFFLARRHLPPLPVIFVGKAGTFVLLYALPLLYVGHWDNPIGTVAYILGWAFAFWGVGLYWYSGYVYMRQGIRLLQEHPAGDDSTHGAQQ